MNRNFELSKYQEDILDFINNRKGNLLVDAKAGSGKTSTLIFIADELAKQGKKSLYLAYNKNIVEELSSKLPDKSNCDCRTIYGAGYSFIFSYLCRKYGYGKFEAKTDTADYKLRELVTAYYDEHFRDIITVFTVTGETNRDTIKQMSKEATYKLPPELKYLHRGIINDFVNLCNQSRTYNVDFRKVGSLDFLVYKFCDDLEVYIKTVLPDYQDLVAFVIEKDREMFENPTVNLQGLPYFEIGFTDMIYFPVYYNMGMPSTMRQFSDTILVDERTRFKYFATKILTTV